MERGGEGEMDERGNGEWGMGKKEEKLISDRMDGGQKKLLLSSRAPLRLVAPSNPFFLSQRNIWDILSR